MTAKTRRLVSDDFGSADDTGSIAACGRDDARGPGALGDSAWPFNDNARSDGIHSEDLSSNAASESWSDRPAATPTSKSGNDAAMGCASQAASEPSLSPRRRGPLVTRWIGFAARRRQVQARASQMRDGTDLMDGQPSGSDPDGSDR